jgi:hypothetical protein
MMKVAGFEVITEDEDDAQAFGERLVSRPVSTADFDLSFLGIFERWRAQVFTPFN